MFKNTILLVIYSKSYTIFYTNHVSIQLKKVEEYQLKIFKSVQVLWIFSSYGVSNFHFNTAPLSLFYIWPLKQPMGDGADPYGTTGRAPMC